MKRFFLVNVIMAAFSLCSMLYAQTVEKGATQEMSVGSSNLEANLMQAIDAALGEAQKALLTALPENKTVAVLPLPSQKQGTFNSGSNDFFVEKMTNILTQHGYKVAVSKEDEVFNELVKQIVWDAKRSFFCEKAEVVKRLGQMKNAQVLLYGSINKVSMFGNHINVELPLYAIDVDKATHLWGDTFKGSAFLGKDIDGIVEMPTEFMNLFTKVFDDAGKELKQAFKDKMLMDKVNAHTVAMLPMNGDIDQYVTGKAREMFT